MKLCVVSHKPVWRAADGTWMTDGGFPAQMSAMAALFDETTLVVVETPPRGGGISLPPHAAVVALPMPGGQRLVRKLAVVARLPFYASRIAAEVRRADVVHTPLPGDMGIIGLAVGQCFRKRVIARYCGSWFANSQTTPMNRLVRFWMRRTAGGRNVMLATGSAPAPPAPSMHWVFATAVSAAELAQVTASPDRGASAPLRLVFIGRLSREKGLHLLLDALVTMRAAGVKVPHLSLIGDGPERASLEQAALAHALPVTFHGQLTREALSRELLGADICVQPSLSEGFSKAWLDALSRGVPVIASDVGAARHVLGGAGERGWLVEPGSAESLVATLSHVLNADVDWPALRRRCRAFADAHTLEQWGAGIGGICAHQWRLRLHNGKLTA